MIYTQKEENNTTREWEGMGVIHLGLGRDGISSSCFVGLGRDGKGFIFIFVFFVGVGRERFESPFPCHPLVWICYYNSNEFTFKS